jgi:release factor glutamine methyltransferase
MNQLLTIAGIRTRMIKSLSGLYDQNEIRNFVYLIFGHLLNYSKIEIYVKDDETISQHLVKKIDEIINRLSHYEPIQYILGKTEFFGINIKVAPGVLIPRPETEELVNWVIKENTGRQISIIDLGTGSGCIAIALAKHLPAAQITGIDISNKAIRIAKENAIINGANISFMPHDLFQYKKWFQQKYDVFVSNPPYVRESEKADMEANVLNYEPHQALFVPDHDPLVYYRIIADAGKNYLKHKGAIYCEINEALPDDTYALFKEFGYQQVILKPDINGKPRMIKAVLTK